MKNILIAIVLMTVVIHSCNKTHMPNIPINPALMQNYGFKQGTYWIYLDSVSGRVDSFVVTKAIQQFNPGTTFTSNSYLITVVIYDEDTVFETWLYDLSDSFFSFQIYSSIPTENYYKGTIFMYPIFIGYYDSTSTGIDGIADIYPSYFYNGERFNIVAKIRRFNSAIFYEGILVNDWFYSCDKIGFVKIIFNHSQDSVYKNWNLLRYHIAL